MEECFNQFRPRSGINKAVFFENGKLHHPNLFMADRPRYYMPDKNDLFKYWTSYRTELGQEYGIASKIRGSQYDIEDACPLLSIKSKYLLTELLLKCKHIQEQKI